MKEVSKNYVLETENLAMPEIHVIGSKQDENIRRILYIDACPRKESRTRRLADHLACRLEGSIERLVLNKTRIRSLREKDIIRRDKCLAEGDFDADILAHARQFARADEIVIAAPFWNLSFPAYLKSYIENVNVCGVTFEYNENGEPAGLCRAKRLFYVTTSGGRIPDDNVFGYGYIRTLCSFFFGIRETHSFTAEELDIMGKDTEAILAEAEKRIDRFFAE